MGSVLNLLGNLHPSIVHFPVALLTLAGALALLTRGRPDHRWSSALGLLLDLAALGGAAAVATGWLFAAREPFHGEAAVLLARHRWLGVGVALCAALAAILRRWWSGRPVLAAATLGALLVLGTGYLGGELVFGEGHLWEPPDSELLAEAPPESDGKVDFRRQVQPILRRSCQKCHSARKHEGGLRLDRRDLAMLGGEDGVVIRPGDPDGSELIRRISLPLDDDDYMPGKGRPLTTSQIATLRAWVEQGAEWPE